MRADLYTQAHKGLVEATRTVREYAGSDASRAILNLMDALAASYALDLVTVTPENLVRLQSQLRQVAALRDVIANDGGEPKL